MNLLERISYGKASINCVCILMKPDFLSFQFVQPILPPNQATKHLCYFYSSAHIRSLQICFRSSQFSTNQNRIDHGTLDPKLVKLSDIFLESFLLVHFVISPLPRGCYSICLVGHTN